METKQPEALRLADYLEADEGLTNACNEAAAELRRLRECEHLFIEREHARIMHQHSLRLMTSIYSMLYPPATTLPDGRVMVFRPTNIDPHSVLQELSDRIRALPDEIAAIAKATGEAA